MKKTQAAGTPNCHVQKMLIVYIHGEKTWVFNKQEAAALIKARIPTPITERSIWGHLKYCFRRDGRTAPLWWGSEVYVEKSTVTSPWRGREYHGYPRVPAPKAKAGWRT